MTLSQSRALVSVRHVTGFTYASAAESSYNEARVTPPDLARQRVVSSSLSVTPMAVQSTYRDYFDNIVTTFDLHEPHERLEVVAEATVETVADESVADLATLGDLVEPSLVDRLSEFLAPTPRTTVEGALLEPFARLAGARDVVDDVVARVVELVRGHVAYERGVTVVSSTAQEVWIQGRGVCQDLTHVTIAALRHVGVPARYVSGYFLSRPDVEVGEVVTGESHAWVEYFASDWRAVDPTNGGPIGVHHVVVAKGREYGDVAPLKGVYHGGPSSALGVTVEMSRLG